MNQFETHQAVMLTVVGTFMLGMIMLIAWSIYEEGKK